MDIHNVGWLKITTHQFSSGHRRGKCQLNLCVWMCVLADAGMLMHTWVWLAMPAWGLAHPHICIIPVCFRLGQWTWMKLQRVCICSHMWVEAQFWIQTAGQIWLEMNSVAQNTGGVGISAIVSHCRSPSAPWAENNRSWTEKCKPGRPWLPLFRTMLWRNKQVVDSAALRTGWLLFSNAPLSGPHHTSTETDRTIDYPSLCQRTYNYRSL